MATIPDSRSPSSDPSGLRQDAALHMGVGAFGLAIGAAAFGTAYGAAVPVLLIALALFLPIAAVAIWKIADYHPYPAFGWPNVVTTTRTTLTCLLAGGLYLAADNSDPILGWSLTGLAVISLVLDGVDGWLARKFELSSAFGARFDMEVDAILIMVLSVAAFVLGKAGVWVLACGLIRYLFVAAGFVLPWMNKPLPPSVIRRKGVCVILIAALTLVLSPLVDAAVSPWVAGVALFLLIISFAIDIRWLVITSRPQAEPKA